MWPFGEDWGSKRQAVRDYLKKIWEENVPTVSTPPSIENTRKEAREILEVLIMLYIKR